MTDLYTQIVNTPVGQPRRQERRPAGAPRRWSATSPASRCSTAGRCSAPRPAGGSARRSARRWPAPASTPRPRHGDGLRAAAADAGLDAAVWNADAPGGDQLQGAGLRRERDRAAATQPRRAARASSTRRSARSRPNGRLLVLGTPPEDCAGPARAHRPARAGGLHPLARQGGSRRRHGAARVRRARAPRASWTRRCGSCCRRGRPTSRARWSASAGRQAPPGEIDWERPLDGKVGAGHRRLARHRRGDRRDARARRRARRRPRHPGPGRRPARRDRRAGRHRRRARHHRRRRPAAILRSWSSEPAASTWSSTTPASPATRRSPAWTEDRWRQVLDINLSAQERIDDALLDGEALGARRADRLRVLDERHRRQQRPDQLRDVEGGRDRDGPGAGARAGASAARPSTPSRPGSSRPR